MPEHIGRPDYDAIRASLYYAPIHLKLVFDLRATFGFPATRPSVSYLEAFSWGHHIAEHEELVLTRDQEEQAFAALGHCATYISVVQVHTALESVHDDPFQIDEADVASAFQSVGTPLRSVSRAPKKVSKV